MNVCSCLLVLFLCCCCWCSSASVRSIGYGHVWWSWWLSIIRLVISIIELSNFFIIHHFQTIQLKVDKFNFSCQKNKCYMSIGCHMWFNNNNNNKNKINWKNVIFFYCFPIQFYTKTFFPYFSQVFGISGCATNVLSHQGSGFIPGICYGLGATVAIFFCGPISGK